MKNRKWIAWLLACCLLFAGCFGAKEESNVNQVTADTVATNATEAPETIAVEQTGKTILPLPDTTMENLTDAILSVSLAEGDAYVDDEGIMQMNLKIYSYDRYDMVDIAELQVGDILVRHSGEVTVTSMEKVDAGMVIINGGLEYGGFELATDDSGLFYEMGFNDSKNWYEVGEATIRVSVDFRGVDNGNLELGEVILYPGDFLVGAVTNYDFTPYNTTVRVEAGQIVEMNRRYIP